jgi:hypothetical protein
MAGILWTEKEIEILKELATAGRDAREISLVLKSRSRAAIHEQASRQGISVGAASQEPEIDFEAFKKMLKTVRNPKCV